MQRFKNPIEGEGDFVATFGLIYMSLFSFLVWGGSLDTGSHPSEVDD